MVNASVAWKIIKLEIKYLFPRNLFVTDHF